MRKVTLLIVTVLFAFIGWGIWRAQTLPSAAPTTKESPATPTPTPPTEPVAATLNAAPANKPKTDAYPLHTNITATVFWVGEPVGNGSSENNAISAWDDAWQVHFGCFDNPASRTSYLPTGCTPKENPFYLDLPYNDFTEQGTRKVDALGIVPWAKEKNWNGTESLLKNRWVKISRANFVCYGQIEDAGPYEYNDSAYVFGSNDTRPKSLEANNAGLDVSPALRDCLHFNGLNNDENKVNWQFVDEAAVPSGPWKNTVTTSQIFWQ